MAEALGTAYAEIQLKSSAFKSGLASAGASMANWHKRMTKLAVIAIGVVGVAAAVKGLKSVIGAAAEYGQAMAMVKSVTGATGDSYKALDAKAKELGKTTKWTMTQIASGMEGLGRAGFKTNEIINAIGGVSDLAASQMMDLRSAADMVAGAIRGFGLGADQAARVADVYAYAASNSAIQTEDMAETFKYAMPMAKALGYSIEDVSAMTMILGNNMIKGTMAGTSLNFAFSELAGMSDSFVDKLNDLGVKVADITGPNGQLLSMADILDVFREKGLTAGDMMELFGKRAGKGMAILLREGSDALRKYTKELDNAAGTAKRMREIQEDTLQGQATILAGSWNLLKVTIGEKLAPLLKGFIKDTLIPLVNGMVEWAEKSDTLKNIMQALFAALRKGIAYSLIAMGHLLKGAGEMVNAISEGWSWLTEKISGNETLQKAFDAVAGWAKDFADRLVEGFGRIADFIEHHKGPVVAAIIAIGAAFAAWQVGAWIASLNPLTIAIAGVSAALLALIAYWPELTQAWESAKNALMQNETLMAAWQAIKDTAKTIWDGIKESFAGVVQAAQELWAALKEAFAPIGGLFKGAGDSAVTWQDILKGVTDVIQLSMEGVATVIKLQLNEIKTAFKVIGDLLRGDWKQAWEDYKAGIIAIWSIVKDFLIKVWDEIKKVLDATGLTEKIIGAWETLKTKTIAAWEGIKDAITGTWDNIVSWFKGALDNLIQTLTGWMPGWLKKWLGVGEEAASNMKTGLENKTPDAETAASDLKDKVLEAATPAPEETKKVGEAIAQGVSIGIVGNTSLLTSTADTFKNQVIDSLNFSFGIKSPATAMIPTGEHVTEGVGAGMIGAGDKLIAAGEWLLLQAQNGIENEKGNLAQATADAVTKAGEAGKNSAVQAGMEAGKAYADAYIASLEKQDITRAWRGQTPTVTSSFTMTEHERQRYAQRAEQEYLKHAGKTGAEAGKAYSDGYIASLEMTEHERQRYAQRAEQEYLRHAGKTGTKAGKAYSDGFVDGLKDKLAELEKVLAAAKVGSYAYAQALQNLQSFHKQLADAADYLREHNIAVGAGLQALIDATAQYADEQEKAIETLSIGKEKLAELEKALAATKVGSYAYAQALQDLQSFHKDLVNAADYLREHNIAVGESLQALIDATALYADGQEKAIETLSMGKEKLVELEKALTEAKVGSYAYAQALQNLQSFHESLADAAEYLKEHNIAVGESLQTLIDATAQYADKQEEVNSVVKNALGAMGDLKKQYDELAAALKGASPGSLAYADILEGLQSQYDSLMNKIDFLQAHNVKVSDELWNQVAALKEQGVLTRETAIEAKKRADAEKAAREAKAAAEKAQREAEAAAEKAKREAEEQAREAAAAAKEAFNAQFTTPISNALATGGWTGAAEVIRAMAQNETAFVAQAKDLNKIHGLHLSEEGVLKSLVGMESHLLSTLEDRIKLAELAGDFDLAKQLRKTAENIKKMWEPPPTFFDQIKKIIEGWGSTISKGLGMLPGGQGLTALFGVGSNLIQGDFAGAVSGMLDMVQMVTQEIERQTRALEKTFRDLQSVVMKTVDSFMNLIRQTDAYADIQRALNTIRKGILDVMFGFLAPIAALLGAIADLFDEETQTANTAHDISTTLESTKEVLSNLNVPTGWKVNRIRYAVSNPNEPPITPGGESTGGNTGGGTQETWLDALLGRFRDKIQAILAPIQNFTDALNTAWQAIGPAVMEGVLPVLQTFADALSPLADWITNVLAPDLQGFFQAFGQWWASDIDPFLKSEVFPTLGEWGGFLYDKLKDLVEFIGPKVKPLLQDLWDIIEDAWSTTIKPMLQDLVTWIEQHWPEIKAFLENTLKGWLQDMTDKLQKGVDYFKWKIADGAGDASGAMKAIFESESLNLWEKTGLIWNSKSLSLWDKVTQSFGLGVQGVIQAFGSIFGWVGNIVGGALSGIGNFFSGIWGWIGNIFGFQEGGIAYKPTFGVFGEAGPEAVVPLDRLPEISGQPATINIYLGNERIAKVVMKELKSANLRDTGYNLAPVGV